MRKLFIVAMLLALCPALFAQDTTKPDPARQAKIEKALKGLKDEDAGVRASAIYALVELGAKEYAKDIAGFLKDKDAYMQCIAIHALEGLGAKEYAKDIVELLKDKDFKVRYSAILALGRLGAKEYVKDIAGLLKDKDASMRPSAILALGLLGAKEYADEIGKLISDSSGCYVYDEAKKDWIYSTVSAEAERVLKEWGVDTTKK